MQYEIKCFLIDSDSALQEIFCKALQELDPNIICYSSDNGASAIKILQSNTQFIPALIFIHQNMPQMNGIQCLQEIKKVKRLKQVPIYIYSVAEDPVALAEVKQLGGAKFIIKPAGFKGLKDLLSKLLQLQKSLSL